VGCVWAGAALGTIGKRIRNEQTAFSAYLHAVKAKIEAGDGTAAHALEKSIGLAGFLLLFSVGAHDGFASVIENRHGGVIVR